MTTAYISHPVFLQHEMTKGHPESPKRLWAIRDVLTQAGVMDLLLECEAPLASKAQICRVHDEALYDFLKGNVPEQGLFPLDPDTYMNAHSLAAARHAAGAVVHASKMLMQGKAKNAFCAVRPPGHHAEREKPMGFCLFNSVAVGAAYLLEEFQLERVAIVDFDVHHGNGTEDIFRQDSRVLLCSTYQHPYYPHRAGPSVAGRLVNCPLAAGSGSADFRHAIKNEWLPALQAFKPQFVFVSAGFDAHVLDELAQLNLVENDYAWVTKQILNVADRFCQGRVVSSLEGGYHLGALGASVLAHIKVLMDN